eukprot:3796188-Rhodomonas_salina.1
MSECACRRSHTSSRTTSFLPLQQAPGGSDATSAECNFCRTARPCPSSLITIPLPPKMPANTVWIFVTSGADPTVSHETPPGKAPATALVVM